MHQLDCQEDLEKALRALAAECPVIEVSLTHAGMPALRRREPGFEGLVRIITGQQLSVAAAATIHGRLEASGPVIPARFAPSNEAELRACGLSAPKIRTLRAVAAAIGEGRLTPESLGTMPQEEARRQLTAISGIGPWTADIFLLFCLGRADIWPAGDIALQAAVGMAHRLEWRPGAEEAAEFAARWRPYRGAAAHLMWALYAAVKARGALPA
ncbi:MAG: DNA-3-methyladenine glycosylase [Flavobacteriaceae bacterium]